MVNAVEVAGWWGRVRRGRCPECGDRELVTDSWSGEVVCGACGLVVSEVVLDRTPEWRAYTLEEGYERVRVGAPTALRHVDKGLVTTFDPFSDAQDKPFSLTDRRTMLRLKRWQTRARGHSSAERNLAQALNTLTLLSGTLHLSNGVVENAALIYRKALDAGLIRGRSIDGFVAASLYAACRLCRTPYTLKAIIAVSLRSHKEVSRCYRLIQRELGIAMPIDEPMKYVSRIAARAGIDLQTQTLAMAYLREAQTRKAVVGKAPLGMATAALYIAARMSNTSITQRALAAASGVTEVTIRNRYKELAQDLEIPIE
jgi:transcription initiation factor TFIIB